VLGTTAHLGKWYRAIASGTTGAASASPGRQGDFPVFSSLINGHPSVEITRNFSRGLPAQDDWRPRIWSPWIPEREGQMLSEDIDFYEVFRINPTAMALLTADFEFIDANDAFLAAIGRGLEDVIGRNAFEVVPKMPEDSGGHPKWTALEAALTTERREVYQLHRYDIEDPAHPGVFEERYWSSMVTPVRGLSGEVEVLELSAREVTPIISQFRSLQAEPHAAGPTLEQEPANVQVPLPRRSAPTGTGLRSHAPQHTNLPDVPAYRDRVESVPPVHVLALPEGEYGDIPVGVPASAAQAIGWR